tara:strand:- start:3522 stop:3692 length:171 start_codon:yes stop_codon:yes gene_type:complete
MKKYIILLLFVVAGYGAFKLFWGEGEKEPEITTMDPALFPDLGCARIDLSKLKQRR